MPITRREIARFIDHGLLRADATEDELARHCEEAIALGVYSACVAPSHVRGAMHHLSGSRVILGTVVGFPLGFNDPEVKAFEARRAVRDGATELDVVIQIGRLKAGRHAEVREELALVRRAAEGCVVKAILETALLSATEIEAACRIAIEARVHFVKSSTGFGPGGATLEAVRLMRATVGERLGVKASGGIRDADAALAFLEAGATRLGTSRARELLAGFPASDAG